MYIFDRTISNSQDEQRQAFSGMSTSVHGFAEPRDCCAILAQQELVARREVLEQSRKKEAEEKQRESQKRNLELREREAFQQSEDKIRFWLQQSPRGGFSSGSAERFRLEEAFKSIPPSRAHGFLTRLLDVNDPLGKLFRHKLARRTRNLMLQVLCRKIVPDPGASVCKFMCFP
jgi:hypothetical protein